MTGNGARLGRREFRRVGSTVVAVLSLPQFTTLRARVRAAAVGAARPALFAVWRQQGASHLETYNPHANAPAVIRGSAKAILTRVPGLAVTELLPRLARTAERAA